MKASLVCIRFVPCCLQLFPLLLVTGHEYGGYDMDDSEIGVILMTTAMVQLLFQVKQHCIQYTMLHYNCYSVLSVPSNHQVHWLSAHI